MTSKPPDPPRGNPSGAAAAGGGATSPGIASGSRKCPACGATIQPDLPFCGGCGTRVTALTAALACGNCGRPNSPNDQYCPACGHPVGKPGPLSRPSPALRVAPRPVTLHLLDRSGQVTQSYPLQAAITTLGRQGSDINFPDDAYLSPVHAQFVLVDGRVVVRDLGSRNGTWMYIEAPHRLAEGDMILVGSQVLRYRRLGYPGPRPPEQDATRRLGSMTPNADIANLAQIRADGRARDVLHLSPGRTVKLGREQGDWQFPYDPSMSGLHAIIRSEDADFVVADAGSRNGIAVALRGDHEIADKARLLIGDQMLRVEIA